MTHRNYTDKQQIEEFDGDWDDLISPDEYQDVLDRKRFNQSMGKPASVSYTHLTLPTILRV